MWKFRLFSLLLVVALNSTVWANNDKVEHWAISKNTETLIGKNLIGCLIESLKDMNKEPYLTSFENYFEKYKIIEGQFFTVYLAPRFFQKDHVWILTNSSMTTSFDEMTVEQLSELEQFRYLVGEVLLHNFKYDGYFAFIDTQKTYGLDYPHVCLEMIPDRLTGKDKNVFDPFVKLKRVWYALFGVGGENFVTSEEAKETILQFQKSIELAESQGKTLENKTREVKNTLPWNFITKWNPELREYCFTEVKDGLLKNQDLLMDTPEKKSTQEHQATDRKTHVDGEFRFDKEQTSKIEKCVFCNPKIVGNQFVTQWGDFVSLYNYLPYTPGYHFMVLPASEFHLENWQNLSLKDAVHVDQFLQAYAKAIKKDSKRDDIIIFLQNGLAGGATVPHSHIHILLRPSKLFLMAMNLTEVTGNKLVGLTADEMAPIREKFHHLLEPFIGK